MFNRFPCFNQYYFVGLHPPVFSGLWSSQIFDESEIFQRVVWMTDIIAGGSLAKRSSLFIKASYGSKAENLSGICFEHILRSFATDGLSTRSCSPGTKRSQFVQLSIESYLPCT